MNQDIGPGNPFMDTNMNRDTKLYFDIEKLPCNKQLSIINSYKAVRGLA